jgi:hypothetical protein
VREPVQMHMLIRCFSEYADQQCMENLYLRFMMREFREIYDLAKRWKEAAEWIAVKELENEEVPKGARSILREREAALFIAVDLLAGTTLKPTPELVLPQ